MLRQTSNFSGGLRESKLETSLTRLVMSHFVNEVNIVVAINL